MATPRKPGLLTRLRRAFVVTEEEAASAKLRAATERRRQEEVAEARALSPGLPEAAPSAAEATLGNVIAALERGEPPKPAPDSPELLALVGELESAGHEPIACSLLERLLVLAPKASDTRARLCELLASRGELGRARPHLELLADAGRGVTPLGRDRERVLRAHFLLGEAFERERADARALRHYEAAMAIDLDFASARQRAAKLRTRLGQSAPVPAALAPTMAADQALPSARSRYRLLREIGRGGAATVYLARDEELSRDIALKVLHPHLAAVARADARARFFAEARIAAAVRHPAIIAIYDVDEAARLIVMEHCAGGSLRERLRRGALDPAFALRRHVELLEVLAAVHERGVVHRDLKPGNLLFRGDGSDAGSELVLADFGVAHLVDAGGKSSPSSREAVGTLLYMPPEQRRGERATPAGDLFAAGVILYQTLAGAPPFDPNDVLRQGEKGIAPAPVPESAIGGLPPELRADLRAYVATLLSTDAAARPASAPAARAVAARLLTGITDPDGWRARRADHERFLAELAR